LIPAPAWGFASGDLPLVPATADQADADAQRVLVAERVHAYAWAFDERRRDLLAACFTADAVWHGSFGDGSRVGATRGRDAIVAWLSSYWNRQDDQRRHLITTMQVDALTPTRATVICSLLLLSVRQELSPVLTSFYRVGLQLTDGQWLIDDLFEGGDLAF
jgi:hypothetical protein